MLFVVITGSSDSIGTISMIIFFTSWRNLADFSYKNMNSNFIAEVKILTF
jgi:hypothetical protein